MQTVLPVSKILSSTAPPLPPQHFQAVDGLRGFAALLVVIWHLFDVGGKPELRIWHHANVLRPLHDSWCGVNLFLVLSGFCLFWPYARDPRRRMSFVDFARRRMRRILPAYYASMLLIPLLSFLVHRDARLLQNFGGIKDVVLHILLLHSLISTTIFSYNPVYWSLSLEWFWYMTFPVFVLLFRRVGGIKTLAIMAAVTIAWRVGLYVHFGPTANLTRIQTLQEPPLRDFVLGRLFEFGVGMFAAWQLANGVLSKRKTWACLILAPILLVLGHQATPIDPWLPVRHILYGTAFACLLVAVISPHQTVGHRIFGGKFLTAVGEYSYSLYLFHMTIIYILIPILHRHGLLGAKGFIVSLFAIPLILVSAKLAYLAFEKPFMTTPTKQKVTLPSVELSAVVIHD